MKAGVMERRTDTTPDLSLLASVLQNAGQGTASTSGTTAGSTTFTPPAGVYPVQQGQQIDINALIQELFNRNAQGSTAATMPYMNPLAGVTAKGAISGPNRSTITTEGANPYLPQAVTPTGAVQTPTGNLGGTSANPYAGQIFSNQLAQSGGYGAVNYPQTQAPGNVGDAGISNWAKRNQPTTTVPGGAFNVGGLADQTIRMLLNSYVRR
jgi:hypothetical protein